MKKTPAKKFRYYEIYPDGGGPRGLVLRKPKMRKQDKKAAHRDLFAVVFFPKITGIGKAQVGWYDMGRSLAQTPEAAIAKFMDTIKVGEKWETYHKAGHRVRRIRISDLGDVKARPSIAPASFERIAKHSKT